MNRELFIIAAGKSSRFGNKPKILTKISNDFTVLDNMIEKLNPFFNKINLCIDLRYFPLDYLNNFKKSNIIVTIGGYGELYTIIDCINRSNKNLKDMYIIWSDSIIVDNRFIKDFLNNDDLTQSYSCAVSLDNNPYAYFNVNNKNIVQQSFFNKDLKISKGLHDQSLFRLRKKTLEKEFNLFKMIKKDEYKLLDFFTFNKKCKAIEVSSNCIYSFNTIQNFEDIWRQLNNA